MARRGRGKRKGKGGRGNSQSVKGLSGEGCQHGERESTAKEGISAVAEEGGHGGEQCSEGRGTGKKGMGLMLKGGEGEIRMQKRGVVVDEEDEREGRGGRLGEWSEGKWVASVGSGGRWRSKDPRGRQEGGGGCREGNGGVDEGGREVVACLCSCASLCMCHEVGMWVLVDTVRRRDSRAAGASVEGGRVLRDRS